MLTGTCTKWFDRDCHGLVTGDDGMEDIYVCGILNGCNYLSPGEKVEYEVEFDLVSMQFFATICESLSGTVEFLATRAEFKTRLVEQAAWDAAKAAKQRAARHKELDEQFGAFYEQLLKDEAALEAELALQYPAVLDLGSCSGS